MHKQRVVELPLFAAPPAAEIDFFSTCFHGLLSYLPRACLYMQIDEFIVKKTVGGPARFRPRTREELALALADTEARLTAARNALRRAQGAARHGVGSAASQQQEEPAGASALAGDDVDSGHAAGHESSARIAELEAMLAEQREEIGELHEQVRASNHETTKAWQLVRFLANHA